MLSSQTSVTETWGAGAPDAASVQTTLANVKRFDAWIFGTANARVVDFAGTLARFTELFDAAVGGPPPTSATLAKLLAAALLIAVGRRCSPVWFEAALVFHEFARLCRHDGDGDGGHERRFLRTLTAFQQAYAQCHMLALSDALQALERLQQTPIRNDAATPCSDVEQDLRVYLSLPRPAAGVCVHESWPGPRNAEWQDAALMMWLYGGVYDGYAEAAAEIQAAAPDAGAGAVQRFAARIGAAPVRGIARGEARWRLDELMQRYADLVNATATNKPAEGPTGSGSVLGYVAYVHERDAAANVMMEYFVNTVCQFPTFDSSQYLPEAMRRVALPVLQLQMRLARLIDVSQLSDTAHALYAALEGRRRPPARTPLDAWMNDAARLYAEFESSCGPAMQRLHAAVHNGSTK